MMFNNIKATITNLDESIHFRRSVYKKYNENNNDIYINQGAIITNFDELEEGKEYFIKINNYTHNPYDGKYTYTGSNRSNEHLLFTNLNYDIKITKSESVNGYSFGLRHLNSNIIYNYYTGSCNIFEISTNEISTNEISTNEYVLK
jgi:hypothetical protein